MPPLLPVPQPGPSWGVLGLLPSRTPVLSARAPFPEPEDIDRIYLWKHPGPAGTFPVLTWSTLTRPVQRMSAACLAAPPALAFTPSPGPRQGSVSPPEHSRITFPLFRTLGRTGVHRGEERTFLPPVRVERLRPPAFKGLPFSWARKRGKERELVWNN